MVKFHKFQRWALSTLFTLGLVGFASATGDCSSGCPGFKTYTQGGWGSDCSGNNPGSILANNFATVFPGGVEIGCTNKLKFTSAAAVNAYLPAGGTATSLSSGIKTNPTSGGGVFGGQLLALAINIQMDLSLPSFGSSAGNLKDLKISSGSFSGWTVQQFFDEANKKIGGCSAANFSFSTYSDAAAKINENYDNGTVNKGYLSCPTLNASGVVTHVKCKNGNTGAITLTVSGGVPPYTFKWNNNSTSQNRTGLSAGNYSVTVKDAIGQTKYLSFCVTQPSSSLSAAIFCKTDLKCFGAANGSINLSVCGGSTPYTYLWSNGATTQDISGLAGGTYSVTVTDKNGCTATASTTITSPAAINCSINKVDVKCFGGSNGSIDLTVSGGTSPYTYLWSNGATTQDLSGLSAGTYTVTIKDKNCCTSTCSATIEGPAAALTCSTTKVDALCGGMGSVDLTVNGGTADYSFLWSNGATTEDLASVAAGSYSVVITDANGCTTNCSATVEGVNSSLSASATPSPVKCYGGTTGSVDLLVSGGTGPYSFAWSNGATTEDLTGVSAGNYNVTVTDANGCTTNASATVEESAPSALSASALGGIINVACYGSSTGAVDLTVSGGTGPMGFLWSNGATTEDLTGVAAGIYNVTVTDANGCTTDAMAEVGETTELLVPGTKKQSSSCAACDGSAKVMPTGGAEPYTYLWSTGATGTNELTGLCPMPALSVTVTDANGCSQTYDFGPITLKEGCTAVEVTDFAQGLRQDFTPVDANRSVGSAMFGAPQNTDVLGTFYSLGFGGWVILRVDGSIVDKPGNDLKVVETTWHTWDCDRYTERARVEVSQDNVTWYDKGIICQDSEIDIAPLPCISYVRITDVSDRADFVTEVPLADGFDVDGIICLNPPAANGRRGVEASSATTTPEAVKAQALARNITLYPNPADNQLFVNIAGAEAGENIQLSLTDHMGREVSVMNITANGTNDKAEVNMENLKPGMYVVRVNGTQMNLTKKIVKK